jgi:hypothetical protein
VTEQRAAFDRGIDAWNAGDLARYLELYHDRDGVAGQVLIDLGVRDAVVEALARCGQAPENTAATSTAPGSPPTARSFYAVACWETRDGATQFFTEWDIQDEPGEVAIFLEGDIGLVPVP